MIGVVLAALVTGAQLARGNLDGREVVVEGRTIGLTESGFALKVDDVPVTVVTQARPAFLTACSVTQPFLRVTGRLEQVHGSDASGTRGEIIGFRLRPATAEAIVFLPDLRFVLNPFTLGLVLVLLLATLFVLSRRQLRTRTLMAERKRMADDLHDTIEQHLVGAGMLLQIGRIDEAREILLRAKREMRDIVWGLKNDDMMRLTPSEMLRDYARRETQKGVCRIETRLNGLPERLDASRMRDLSLMVREVVGNAVKHGRAQKVAIVCDPEGRTGWCLRLSNDGVPYDAATAPGVEKGHYGLEGLRARARRLGATFTIAAPDGRTVVTIRRAE